MKIIINFLSIFSISILLTSCVKTNEKADGYGNFEATEVTVSAEANGKIIAFNVNEGDLLSKSDTLGYIDTLPLNLKKEQLIASKKATSSRSEGILSQINIITEQEKNLIKDKKRIENLLKNNAGTQKQLDDINGQLNVLKQQINSIKKQNAPIIGELQAINSQLDQLNDQIKKSIIVNPISGTVLVKYAEPNEISAFGKPLYKIALLNEMILKVYVSENQLSQILTGSKVKVKIDGANGLEEMEGQISWISSTAEFTPKVIQTKEERINLVYAVKILVKNDGRLKIGMPAEMWLK